MVTLVNQSSPSLDTSCVRCDRNRHGGGVALFISDKLEYQVTMCGPNELEFLLVSVHNTYSTGHLLIQLH